MEFEPFLSQSGQETGGQDDLVWYTANRQANGTYTVNVKAADHKTQLVFTMSIFTMFRIMDK